MVFLYIIEIALIILVSLLVYTQILLPLSKGTKLFPNFSSKRKTLVESFETTLDEKEIKKLTERLKNLQDN